MTDPLLLYDGTCAFCSATVRFVLQRDRRKALRFAALGSPPALRVVERHPALAAVDSVVWVDHAGDAARERVFVRSDAALRIAGYLGGGWRLTLIGRALPRALRDRAYDWVARHRHHLFPASAECFVPSPDDRERFLDR